MTDKDWITKFANVNDMIFTLQSSHGDDPDVMAAVEWIQEQKRTAQCNATFHAFKPSGKWYTSGRGYLPKATFDVVENDQRIRIICEANGGNWPGLGGPGNDFTLVVIGDEALDFGFPLMMVRPKW